MDASFLLTEFLGKPGWMWLAFVAIVFALLAFDLGVLHRRSHEIGVRESLAMSAFYILLGLLFGAWVWWHLGHESGVAYLTGFVVEKALAMDNVFVIAMIFAYFSIPRAYQHRVLFWGILGVVVLRAIMIGLGAAVVAQANWVLYVFAAFLIATGIKLIVASGKQHDLGSNPALRWMKRRFNVTEDLQGQRFFVRRTDAQGRRALFVTPLFLALVMIEAADLVFAVDSVPAIFAITTDPFLVYTSNIFAILGLRALYFALAAVMDRFQYLKFALAAVLVFIGSKIIAADALGLAKIPPLLSLGVTFALLGAGVAYSLWKTRRAGARAGSARGA